jgi:serine/threonine-protein kinase
MNSVYEVGTLLAGKYRVERILGRGGMAVVVAAEHQALRASVALKFLTPEFAGRADVVERFLREARVCAQLRSEHACRVSDFGRLESGVPYIVMEMLEGRDLANVLAAHGPLAVATAAEYVVQACDALTEAHATGIVHRDLKPANLFLARRRDGDALIKVLDFGVAKVHDAGEQALTLVDMIVGSPAYMAPEQMRSAQHADARSDIWSLGVVLYELASGGLPFRGASPTEVAMEVECSPPPRLAGVPEGFAAAVARCLEPAPERRFQRVADLVAALRPFVPRAPAVTVSIPKLEMSALRTARTPHLPLSAAGAMLPVATPLRPYRRPRPVMSPAVPGSGPRLAIGPLGHGDRPFPTSGPSANARAATTWVSRTPWWRVLLAGVLGMIVIWATFALCQCARDNAVARAERHHDAR